MEKTPSISQIIFTVILANIFWAIVFGGKYVNFWLGMSVATVTLASFSIYYKGLPFSLYDITWRSVFLGIVSAGVLYILFCLGNVVANQMFNFAQTQVKAIYDIQSEGTPFIIFFVLFFITSPAEEIFWRGFLQHWAMNFFGDWQGWFLSSIVYAFVHLWSGNIILTLAAFIAGLFWGILYWKSKNLFLCIVSHAIWTVTIFIFSPVGF